MVVCEGVELSKVQTLDAHDGRVSRVCVSRQWPHILLSASADKTACLYKEDDGDAERPYVLRCRYHGHRARVADVKMHPERESLVVTASFDGTCRLVDDGRLVQEQVTGHAKVYAVAFHPDGSLLATAGLEGGTRVWDMRSGRAILSVDNAHQGGVLGVEFSPNGYTWATCGMDHTVRIWDLRRKKGLKVIAAHRGVVTAIRFAGGHLGGDLLYSGSYDRTVKCWGARRNWGLIVACTNHDEKVTSIDCSKDGTYLVSACYDKMCRVWTPSP